MLSLKKLKRVSESKKTMDFLKDIFIIIICFRYLYLIDKKTNKE